MAHQPKRTHQFLSFSAILSPQISVSPSKSTIHSEPSSCQHAAFLLLGSAYQRKVPETNDEDSEHTAL
jgi:hypothetical protein